MKHLARVAFKAREQSFANQALIQIAKLALQKIVDKVVCKVITIVTQQGGCVQSKI